MSIPSISRQTYAECLWTGCGIHVCRDQSIDLTIPESNLRDGRIITPIMPASPFDVNKAHKIVNLLERTFRLEDKIHAKPIQLHELSHVVKHSIQCVPIRISADLIRDITNDPDADGHPTSLRNFQPASMLKVNIGSNSGLARLLSEVDSKANNSHAGDPKRYIVRVSDCNIFMRELKVPTLIILILWIGRSQSFGTCVCV